MRCPACGKSLQYSINEKKMICPECGCTREIGELPWGEDEALTEAGEYEVNVFTCPECGGEIRCTGDETVDRCCFCGSSAAMDVKKSREPAPKYIVPFSVDKKSGISRLRSFASGVMFAPPEYRDETELAGVQPLYLPYWSYEVTQRGNVTLEGLRYDEKRRKSEKCSARWELDTEYPSVLFDASEGFDDEISMLIAPFSRQKRKDFHPAYLSGSRIAPANVDSEVYAEAAKDAANERTYQRLSVTARDGSRIVCPRPKQDLANAIFHTELGEADTAMMPVWMFTWRKKDRVAYTAVNGESGKTAGDIPIDFTRFFPFLAGMTAALFLLFFFVFPYLRTDILLAGTAVLMTVSLDTAQRTLNFLYRRETHADDRGVLSHMTGKPLPLERAAKSGIPASLLSVLVVFISFFFRMMMRNTHDTMLAFEYGYRLWIVCIITGSLIRIGRQWLAMLKVLHDRLLLFLTPVITAVYFLSFVVILVLPLSDFIFYEVMILLAGLNVILLAMLAGRLIRITTRPLPDHMRKAGKSMMCMLLAAGICLSGGAYRTARAQAQSADRIRKEEGTEAEETQPAGEVAVADLTGLLSPKQLEQVRQRVSGLSEYMDVYILYANYSDKQDKKRDLYREAFGFSKDEVYHKTCFYMDIYPDEGFGNWYVNSEYPDSYYYLGKPRLRRLICEACLENGDPVGAAGESADFALGMIEMEKLYRENETTRYSALVTDYSGKLSEEKKESLLEKGERLTDYTSVLVSIGTLDELIDTDGMTCMKDKYVRQDMSGTPGNYYDFELTDYSMKEDDRNILHIYINKGEAGIDCTPKLERLLEYLRQETKQEENSELPEDDAPDAAINTRGLDLLDEASRKEAVLLAEQGRYSESAEVMMDYFISTLESTGPEAEAVEEKPQIRLPVDDIVIMDNAGLLNENEEKQLTDLMKQLSPYGKAAFITYYNAETHGYGRNRTTGKYCRQYMSEDLGNFDFFSGNGIVVVVDRYHGEIGIFRNGKMLNAVSGSYTYAIRRKAEKYFRNKNRDYYRGASEVFEGILKMIEEGRKARPLKVIFYLLLAAALSLMTGLLLVLKGRTDQVPDIGDLTAGDSANVVS